MIKIVQKKVYLIVLTLIFFFCSLLININFSFSNNNAQLSTNENNIMSKPNFEITDTSEIRDIKPLMKYEFIKSNFNLLANTALLLIIILLLYYLLSKYLFKNKQIDNQDLKIILPPDIVAKNELLELDKLQLLENGQIKEYYMKISYILRLYLGLLLKFNCVDLSTNEIISYLQKLNISSTHVIAFEAISNECDLVKFAKFIPDIEDAKKIRISLENFINATKRGLR